MSEPSIDRITPTLRPEGRRAIMYQKWRTLLFLHWEVPAGPLQELLPPGLTLDTFEGRAFVGLVPFTMCDIRAAYLPPIPGLARFHETNVRTYVHRQGQDPGVWFFSLEAANSVAVQTARSLFGLSYHRARMSLERDNSGHLHYRSERLWPSPLPAKSDIHARLIESTPTAATPGTLDHFLLERYLLYTVRGKHLYRGQVHHPTYLTQRAEPLEIQESLISAAGVERPSTPPLGHYCEGVDVEIFWLDRVDPQ